MSHESGGGCARGTVPRCGSIETAMRVLLITNDYPPKPGGIQQYLGNIVSRFAGPIRVLAPADPDAEYDELVIRSDQSFMWPTPSVRRWVDHHVDDFRPDVVVFGAPYPLAWLAKTIDLPSVVMAHGAETVIPFAVPGLAQLVGSSMVAADHVFTVSDFTADVVRSRIARPVSTLGAGVDTGRYYPAPLVDGGRMVIGCVSRFVPRKGHARVIAAADSLYNDGVDCEVLLVGKGRLERKLRRAAAKADVPVRIEVDPRWERLADLYRQMSVFVMPAVSRWGGLEVEGLGIVYLEAAASGLPVLAGPSGGSPETVIEGETGFVVGSVAEIEERLSWFVEDRARLVSFGAAGRAWAEERWTWDQVMVRFVDGLESAVRHRVER